ncbi:MAG: hypothetical protein WC859_05025 [Elusimicrobiota bacterium]|jgi:hypothetical protein
MKLIRVFVVLCCFGLFVPVAQAAVPITDVNTALGQVTADSVLVSQWFSDQFRYVIPFNATTGMVVPKQLKIWGIELGIEGAVSGTKVDMEGLRNLPTNLVDTQQVDNFDRFPFPAIIAHAKVGLPFGLDAGIRLGGIPKTTIGENKSATATEEAENTKVTLKNRIFGIDVRKKIVEEGVGKPGVTVGLNFTRVSGSIDATKDFKTSDNATVTIAEGYTADYTSTLDATGGIRSEWDMNSFGVQAIVNKQILFMNPYLGASANLNSGSVSTAIDTAGTLTLTNPLIPADTVTQAVSTRGVGSASANKWDVRGLAGIEFSILPFTKLGLQGEFAGTKNLGASLGLRVQFR